MNAKTSDDADAEEPAEAGKRTDRDEIEELEVRLFLEALHARYGYDLRGYSAMSKIGRASCRERV